MTRNITVILLLAVHFGLSGQAQEAEKPRILKQWTLSSDFTEEINKPVDTVFSLFHLYRLTNKYSPLNVDPGNYGLPFYQFSFFDRITDPDKFLYAGYYPFMHTPERAVFMNTQVPYTEGTWTISSPRETAEQTFMVRHSQSVNRFLNFGLIYDITYSLGQYNYQRADNKNFLFHSSYTGIRYKYYFAAGINKLLSYENGGISDPGQLGLLETRDVPVHLGSLNKATSLLKNNNILLVQRYTVSGRLEAGKDSVPKKRSGFSGLKGTFSHVFIWENNKRAYSDSYPQSGFYDTIFINRDVTFDSLFSQSIRNTIRFDFMTDETRKFRLGGGAGLRNELFRYSQMSRIYGPLRDNTVTTHKSNNAVVGRLFSDIGEKFRWTANGELFLTGYRAGDFSIYGEILKSFSWNKGMAIWKITGAINNRQPAYWYERWIGNHFMWHNNDLKKEFRIDLGTQFSFPARNADIKFNYAIIDNYTDFNTDALPSQHGGGLSVASLFVRKDLRAWKFHLAGDILVQKSSNEEILDLPLVTLRADGFFEHLIRFKKTGGKLNTQIGAEIMYHTLYYPYSYMPATGRFYRQQQTMTGNYPFLNAFVNLKLRRARIFVMLDHLNSGFMGYDFYMIPSYPVNTRMIRYGIAVTFYD
ncbi:MAG: putative porin [Bacteroidales bacterium]|nr:putative porin [Bacteroidales bacterium]